MPVARALAGRKERKRRAVRALAEKGLNLVVTVVMKLVIILSGGDDGVEERREMERLGAEDGRRRTKGAFSVDESQLAKLSKAHLFQTPVVALPLSSKSQLKWRREGITWHLHQ